MDSSQQLDQVGTLFVREPMESLGARFSNEVGDVLENRPALRGEPQGMRPPVRRIEAPLHPAIGFHPVEDPHQRHGIELRQLRQTLLAHAFVVLQMQQRAALRTSERQRLRAPFEPPRVATARVLEQESELAAEVHDHNGLYSITLYHIYGYHHLVLAESSPVESAPPTRARPARKKGITLEVRSPDALFWPLLPARPAARGMRRTARHFVAGAAHRSGAGRNRRCGGGGGTVRPDALATLRAAFRADPDGRALPRRQGVSRRGTESRATRHSAALSHGSAALPGCASPLHGEHVLSSHGSACAARPTGQEPGGAHREIVAGADTSAGRAAAVLITPLRTEALCRSGRPLQGILLLGFLLHDAGADPRRPPRHGPRPRRRFLLHAARVRAHSQRGALVLPVALATSFLLSHGGASLPRPGQRVVAAPPGA